MELIISLLVLAFMLFLWIFYPWESVRTSKFKKAKEAREARQLIEDAKRDAKDHPLD